MTATDKPMSEQAILAELKRQLEPLSHWDKFTEGTGYWEGYHEGIDVALSRLNDLIARGQPTDDKHCPTCGVNPEHYQQVIDAYSHVMGRAASEQPTDTGQTPAFVLDWVLGTLDVRLHHGGVWTLEEMQLVADTARSMLADPHKPLRPQIDAMDRAARVAQAKALLEWLWEDGQYGNKYEDDKEQLPQLVQPPTEKAAHLTWLAEKWVTSQEAGGQGT